jgi:hypothetical protein
MGKIERSDPLDAARLYAQQVGQGAMTAASALALVSIAESLRSIAGLLAEAEAERRG